MTLSTRVGVTCLAALAGVARADITPDWTSTLAPPNFELLYDTVTAPDGATYVVMTVTTGSGPADKDIGVVRINPDGSTGWQAQWTGPIGQDIAAAIAMSWDGSAVYALGRASVPGFGNSDFVIIKYDASTGQELWSALYDGGDLGIDSPYDIAGTPDGGVVATGGIDTPNEQRDFGTVKLDSAGAVVWERKYTGQYIFLFENDDSEYVRVTPEGDVVISGTAVSFDREKVETIKYDGATGATIWEAEYNSPLADFARGLVLAPNGDAVVFISDPAGLDRSWTVVRYDGSTGAARWTTTVDPGQDESQRAIHVGPDGTVYAAGMTDPDGDDSNGNNNAIVIAYEPDTGAVRWLLEFGDEGNFDSEYGAGLYDDGAGSLYVVGATSSDSLVSNPFDTDGLILRVDTETGALVDIGLVDTTPVGGSVVSDNFRHIGVDASGGVYAIGTASGSSGGDILVSKFSTGTACVADLAEPFGDLNFSDVLAFLTAFAAQAPGADIAEPFGQWDFSDVVAFLAAFGAGCP